MSYNVSSEIVPVAHVTDASEIPRNGPFVPSKLTHTDPSHLPCTIARPPILSTEEILC